MERANRAIGHGLKAGSSFEKSFETLFDSLLFSCQGKIDRILGF